MVVRVSGEWLKGHRCIVSPLIRIALRSPLLCKFHLWDYLSLNSEQFHMRTSSRSGWLWPSMMARLINMGWGWESRQSCHPCHPLAKAWVCVIGIYTSRVMIFSVHNLFLFFYDPTIFKPLFWSSILFDGRKFTQSIFPPLMRGLRHEERGLSCTEVSGGEAVAPGDHLSYVAFAVM